MARVAFAWELGGGLGHVMSCAGLAGGLELRGHRIAFMFRELPQLGVIPESRNYDVFQAPRSPREGEGVSTTPASYADILLGCGFADPRELAGLAAGWRSLLAGWKPDLVVADFAPTALLAARTLGLPCVTYGSGFFVPPRASPLPPFRVDTPVDPGYVASADARALASVNQVLERFGTPRLEQLAQLFDAREHFLCTFPELDHYGNRETSGYWGPRVRFDRGADVAWPDGTGKHVFVYVRAGLHQLDELIDVLRSSPHRVIAYIPGLDDKRRERLAGRTRIVSERPIRLERFIRSCDLLVAHGGDLAMGALMHGVPSLNFPVHYEQYLTARRLEQLGAGGWVPPGSDPGELARGFNELIANPRFGTAARAFAQRYPAYSPQEQRRRILVRIEELLRGPEAILPPASTPPEARP